MLPFRSTACGGKSTKLPGRAPAEVPGVNSPPGAASKIDMFKMSPTPTTWVGFARLSGNAPFKVIRLGCDKKPMVSELMSTSAYGRDAVDLIPAVALALTASLVGPVPGNRLQAGNKPARMMEKSVGARRFSISERPDGRCDPSAGNGSPGRHQIGPHLLH